MGFQGLALGGSRAKPWWGAGLRPAKSSRPWDRTLDPRPHSGAGSTSRAGPPQRIRPAVWQAGQAGCHPPAPCRSISQRQAGSGSAVAAWRRASRWASRPPRCRRVPPPRYRPAAATAAAASARPAGVLGVAARLAGQAGGQRFPGQQEVAFRVRRVLRRPACSPPSPAPAVGQRRQREGGEVGMRQRRPGLRITSSARALPAAPRSRRA